MAFENPERVLQPFHLRGRTLPFWIPDFRARLVDYLRREEVEWLLIDPAQRAQHGYVENSNDNDQVTAFTNLLDQLKEEAGISNLLISTHTGRAKVEEGDERARSATRYEDWMDAGWYLTKDKANRRALRALGRDVELDAQDLTYDARSRRSSVTGMTRNERRTEDGVRAAVATCAQFNDSGERPPTSALETAIPGDAKKRNGWIQAAEKKGYIVREPVGQAKVCEVTDAGRKFLKHVDFR